VHLGTVIALVLAVASTTLTNLAYSREHDAAAQLPVLCMRRPIHSVHLLLSNPDWLIGFAMESTGFLCYAAALALASLALVQSIGAGGIGVLAWATARVSGRRLPRRQQTGVVLSVVGLLALAVSLIHGSGAGSRGSTAAILIWIAGTIMLALVIRWLGHRLDRPAIAEGIAGGLFFSVGDLSTKLATQGGTRIAFVVTLIVGYTLGTSLLQIGYQRGTALTVAGLATLLTNALPIAAGTILLKEPVPSGAFGAARVIAYAAVILGAVLLATPQAGQKEGRASSGPGASLPSPAG
jgi:drug/metabolite transporter (DMT)-like permease